MNAATGYILPDEMSSQPTDRRAPNCPKCDRHMILRTARRGPNKGGQFWGCSGYPSECQETVELADSRRPTLDLEANDASISRPTTRRAVVRKEPGQSTPKRLGLAPPKRSAGRTPEQPRVARGLPVARTRGRQGQHRRVDWFDATTNRDGWQVRYSQAGASLRALSGSQQLLGGQTHCWLACRAAAETADPNARLAASLLRRVVQRGKRPPLHPEAERIILTEAGLSDAMESALLPGELSVRLRGGTPDFDAIGPVIQTRTPPLDVASDISFDSNEERSFLIDWLPRVSAVAARWASPQAPLESLVQGKGVEASGHRRVDFLLRRVPGQPIVVEIDGEQHANERSVDDQRDGLLRQAGYEVRRVPAEEIRRGDGVHLARLAARLRGPAGEPLHDEPTLRLLISGPIWVHQTVLALCEALDWGLLGGDRWSIDFRGAPDWLFAALVPYLNLLLGFNRIWGLGTAPEMICLIGDERTLELRSTPDGYVDSDDQPDRRPALRLVLDRQRGPVEALPEDAGIPQIVVRGARVPVEIKEAAADTSVARPQLAADQQQVEWGLTQVLQAVFAKEQFREGQLEALTELLSGRDCAVLLPTGGGKSIIYQLAAFCLPGRTLVVDPLAKPSIDANQTAATLGLRPV